MLDHATVEGQAASRIERVLVAACATYALVAVVPPPLRYAAQDSRSPAAALLSQVWMAKYGHKRWGLGYVDKSALDEEKKVGGGRATGRVRRQGVCLLLLG